MNTVDSKWKADPMVWGHGSKGLEVFLEPTCPFSAKAFDKLDELLVQAGEDRLRIKIRLLSQPWHLFSPVVTRAILAASTTAGGKSAAKAVMAAVFAHREEFVLINHCSGPNLEQSIRGILSLIERYSGIQVSAPFELPELNREMKWHAKYARQNGIHTTPTFMVDGLVSADMNSSDTVETWVQRIGFR